MLRGRTTLFVLVILALLAAGVRPAAADNKEESIDAWRRWKDIHKAIEIRPLDVEADILEKVEIIDDRIDALEREKKRLENERRAGEQRLQSLLNQREVLKDLTETRQGADVQTSQRLHDLTDRIQREEALAGRRKSSLEDLAKEMENLRNLEIGYRARANSLRHEEGKTP